MAKAIRVRYENGVLKPLEKLDLREGEEIEIIIRKSFRGFHEKFKSIVLKSDEDIIEEFIQKRR